MAAIKRKSNDNIGSSTKKQPKLKKSTTSKPKEGPTEKKAKSVSITFPEEGKVEWNAIKKQSKILTEARKQKKFQSNYQLIQEAKKKFEIFRNRKCKGEERNQLIADCTKLMKGLINTQAKSHDVARLIQWLLKLGSKDIKHTVVNEVISDVVTLAKCKYSSHVVKNIIVNCDSTVRRRIIDKFSGNVVKLLSNKISAPILHDIYIKYATAPEKAGFKRELYGDLCKPLIPIDSELRFAELLASNKALAPSILSGLKSSLSKLLQKEWLLESPIVMAVLHDYLLTCLENDRLEMLELVRSHVSIVINSKPGADVGLILLKHSSAKEKKEIIKNVKGEITNIATSPSGSVFLQHMIDSVDDTVLMKKVLLPSIIENAQELIENENGRKLLSYIVAHRNTNFFHPSEINKLKSADDSAFVKKNADVRMKELQEACVPTLLSKIALDPMAWLKDGCTCLLTSSILQLGSGDSSLNAFMGIADFLVNQDSKLKRTPQPNSINTTEEIHAIEDTAINKILKKTIKDDASRAESEQPTFSQILVEKLDKDCIKRWVETNRGCFILVFLLECGIGDVVEALKSKIKVSKIGNKLNTSEYKGAEILSKLISN